jgi:hypothetical protein
LENWFLDSGEKKAAQSRNRKIICNVE